MKKTLSLKFYQSFHNLFSKADEFLLYSLYSFHLTKVTKVLNWIDAEDSKILETHLSELIKNTIYLKHFP